MIKFLKIIFFVLLACAILVIFSQGEYPRPFQYFAQ